MMRWWNSLFQWPRNIFPAPAAISVQKIVGPHSFMLFAQSLSNCSFNKTLLPEKPLSTTLWLAGLLFESTRCPRYSWLPHYPALRPQDVTSWVRFAGLSTPAACVDKPPKGGQSGIGTIHLLAARRVLNEVIDRPLMKIPSGYYGIEHAMPSYSTSSEAVQK